MRYLPTAGLKKSGLSMATNSKLLGSLILAIAVACGPRPSDSSATLALEPGGSVTTETPVSSTRPLDSGTSFRLGYGYDMLSGERSITCLDTSKYSLAARTNRDSDSRVILINSKEDLAKTLNIEVNAEASGSYGMLSGSISSKVNIVKNATFHSRTIMGLMYFYHTAQTLEIEGPYQLLTEEAQELLAKDKKAFRARCGDVYTRAVTTGSAVYVTIKLESTESDTANQVANANTVKASFNTIFSASGSSSVSNEVKQALSKFSISLSCGSVGISTEACAEAFSGVNADDLNAVMDYMNRVKKRMSDSVMANPNLMVALDERFDTYPKPEAQLEMSSNKVFFDYSSHLTTLRRLLDMEIEGNTICSTASLQACQSFRESVGLQVRNCARQSMWPDCNVNSIKTQIETLRSQMGSGTTTNNICAPRTFKNSSDHSFVEFVLPEKANGSIIEVPGGAYNKYVFPKCNRVWWDDLRFTCINGIWERTSGRWDADGLCHGSHKDNPHLRVGTY